MYELYDTYWNKFWNDTCKGFEEIGIKTKTIETRFYAFKSFIKITDSENLDDLEDLSKVKFYVQHRKKAGLKDNSIIAILHKMNSIIDYWLSVQEFENTPYKFNKNVFRYYIFKSNFVNDTESHLPRSELEVFVWIKTIEDISLQALWVFYSIGLRRHEPLKLKREQFDLDKQVLINVERKTHKNANKLHKMIYLPSFTIPYIKNLLDLPKNKIKNKSVNDTLFTFKDPENVSIRSNVHFKHLMNMKAKLEKTERNAYWENIYQGLLLIEKNGKIAPHQLRTTWDTLSVKYGCRDVYRRYHLNHRLKGEDEIYVQIAKIPEVFQDYANNIEKNSPNYGL